MESRYASAERNPIEMIRDDFTSLNNSYLVEKLINSLPYLGAVINDKRQVVYANENLLEYLNIHDLEKLLGQRPGELLSCVNANNETGGCGTTEKCTVCGAVNCILASQREDRKMESECRINATRNNNLVAYDFKVTSSPFILGLTKYYILSFVDISDVKRRKAMERIFYHDVINKVSSIYGLIELLKMEKDPQRIKEFVDLLEKLNSDLTDEILWQRDLAHAENGELTIDPGAINSVSVIEESAAQMKYSLAARNKTISLGAMIPCEIKTDLVLLRRILMNMLKNALEASDKDQAVTIGCKRTANDCRFWVHNSSIMPAEVKLQLFQRSFSTKGTGRGLGTFSIKLIGENYLKGKTGFSSEEGEGTTFYIDLPCMD